MDYLTRPVFEFEIDWNRPPSGPWHYDLKELQVGFGAEFFAPTQTRMVHGWTVECDLLTGAEINAFDTFFANLTGRLQGFWFPGPTIAFKISGGVDANRFDIEDQDYDATFADHPSQYILFTKAGQVSLIGKVIGVVGGSTTERITIDANLTIDATWAAYRLHYVRLSEDVERGEFEGEGKMTRTMRVVELPLEYAAAETGEKPAYLYHFWLQLAGASLQDWYYTSHYQNITSIAQVFTKKPVTHGTLKQSTKQDRNELNLEAVWESDSPLALFYPHNLSFPLWIELWEIFLTAPDTRTKLFTGRIMDAPKKGKKINARAVSIFDLLGRKVGGHIIGPRCPYQVYEPSTCKVNRATYDIVGTISTLNTTRVIRVTAASLSGKGTNYLAGGFIETGFGATKEIRYILQSAVISSTIHELALNAPLKLAVLSQAITCVPGCNGTRNHCINRFNNLDNNGGFYYVPSRNLTIKGPDLNAANQGGKK